MRIELSAAAPVDQKADLLAVGCTEDTLEDNTLLGSLDTALGGFLRSAINEERFKGSPGQTLSFPTQGRLPATRVVLIGLGKRAALALPALRSFGARAARHAETTGAKRLAVLSPLGFLGPQPVLGSLIERLVEGAVLGTYRFDKYFAEDKRTPRVLEHVSLLLGTETTADLTSAVTRAERLAAAIARARDLINEPPDFMTPTRLAEVAEEIARRHKLGCVVLGPEECRAQKMGLFLAVARGSTEEPRFIHLTWKPVNAKKRVVLIGKGVTFDSGGLSLKPNDSMLDMKTDMSGAAAVICAMDAIAGEGLPIEVHVLAACTENMPSGNAYRLGDVLRSKAGKTVEINNTDAEGRLTLADAITYGLALEPDVILDFATLTGACMVALGPHIAGVMSNNEPLAGEWLDAAKTAGEDMWRLPLPDRLKEMLKSDVADMKNTGERWGGALTAGLFLREFVGETPWVHVDLAGPSTANKESAETSKGGTGFGVATILEYLRRIGAS
ncbi:MAG TPA: leucyl aminopeptidase [Polyangia bacterium]